MSTMLAEGFDAFRSMGVPDDKASAAAQALSRRDPDNSGLQGDVAVIKIDVSTPKIDVSAMKLDIAALKVDVAVLKWMMGFVFAGILALVLKAFVH